MHAFLLVGKDGEELSKKKQEIAKETGSQVFNFPLQKIADAREISAYVKLSLNKPTAIYIEDVDMATEEALNAFLKNLEEPQEKLVYILTCKSANRLLPTIISRCQVIKVGEGDHSDLSEIEKFAELEVGEKLVFVNKIRDRQEAIDFIGKFIEYNHSILVSGVLEKGDCKNIINCIEIGTATLKALNANGNVTLQLSNFVFSLYS